MSFYGVFNNTTNAMQCGNRYTAATATYDNNRVFLEFDLTGSGVALAQIVAAYLRINVTAVTGGAVVYNFRQAIDPNGWGSTLDATQADFESTNTNLEASPSISATGLLLLTLTASNLDLNGPNYFRIASTNEGSTTSKNFQLNANEIGTGNRPLLLLVLNTGQTATFAPCLGVKVVQGTSSDGQVRATDVGSPGTPDIP